MTAKIVASRLARRRREVGRGLAIRRRNRRAERGCAMPELRTLMSGLVFGEQPRWHEGRLWFSDWGTRPSIGR